MIERPYGINPSISELVYYLNCWGAETTGSHAFFYPGDTEEQEYWIHKSNSNKAHSGPVVLLGGGYPSPYVSINLPNLLIDDFKPFVTGYWRLIETKAIDFNHTSFKLEYNEPRLIEFINIWFKLSDDILKKFPDCFYIDEYGDQSLNKDDISEPQVKEINKFLKNKLNLNREELNMIRDRGISELKENIKRSMDGFDMDDFKLRADIWAIRIATNGKLSIMEEQILLTKDEINEGAFSKDEIFKKFDEWINIIQSYDGYILKIMDNL